MRLAYIIIFIWLLTLHSFSQEKWSLQQCVEYAITHNISVKQADVQARYDKLTLEQSKSALYPSANSQHSAGYQFGRSIDPTSNQFTTNQILFTNHAVNVNADLFNWFSKKNTIEANKYLSQASNANIEKAKNDIALNVANAYLLALLNKEQINISSIQVSQSREQLINIEKQVKAGALPELNLAEMQTQLATDSATVITATSDYQLALLQLKALLNLDAAQPFDIETPPVDKIPVETLADLDPALVYTSALANLPQQKINILNIKAAERNVLVAKSAMYPSFSFFGGLSSNYSNAQTSPLVGYDKNTYLKQLSNNFSQNVGIGLNIPIFNGNLARTNWKKAQLNVESQQLLKDNDAQTLKQDIYQAHANAVAAIEKYNAAKIAVESAQKAYDFAKKRFEVGLLKPIDLITNQNNLFRAKANMLSSQYDYVFKLKLLEFYKGLGLKL